MERVIREEVGGIHPILGVRILRYPWKDRFALQAVDDGQLQLAIIKMGQGPEQNDPYSNFLSFADKAP